MWGIKVLFNLFRRKRINNITIKKDCDKVAKHIRRQTTKKLRNGMLQDGHSLAEHLNYVDKSYSHIKQDIKNTTLVVDYQKIRSERYSATEQMLDFYQVRYDELQNMYRNVAQVAQETGRKSELSSEKLATIDTDKLRKKFEALNRDEKDWDASGSHSMQYNRRSSAVNTFKTSTQQKIPIFSDIQIKDRTVSTETARREER